MEIEQEFFEAFRIEKIKNIEKECTNPKYKKQGGFLPDLFCDCKCEKCNYKKDKSDVYPPITPEIVLGLISLYSVYEIFVLPISYKDEFENKWNPEKIKCYILEQIISLIKYKPNLSKEITDQVKALFKC